MVRIEYLGVVSFPYRLSNALWKCIEKSHTILARRVSEG
jgi:hypothetical protein